MAYRIIHLDQSAFSLSRRRRSLTNAMKKKTARRKDRASLAGCAAMTPVSPMKRGSTRISGMKKIPCLAIDRMVAGIDRPVDWRPMFVTV